MFNQYLSKIPGYSNHKQTIGLFFVTRIIVIATIWFFYSLFPLNTRAIVSNFVSSTSSYKLANILTPWDGQRFLEIAKNWYPKNPIDTTESSLYVIFPGYPTLIRLFSNHTTDGDIFSGFIINLIASLIGTIYLYKICSIFVSDKIAKRAVLLFLINPATIFFIAIYSESLYFCLSTLCLYYAEKRKFGLSGIFGLLSTLVRSMGLTLIIPFVFIVVSDFMKKSKKTSFSLVINLAFALLIPLGYVLFSFYSSSLSGNNEAYLKAGEFFGRSLPSFNNVVKIITEIFTKFSNFPVHSVFFSKTDVIFIAIFLLLSVYQLKYLPKYYSLYSLSVILLNVSSGVTTSSIRYFAPIFSVYLVLAKISSNRPILEKSIIIVSTMLLTIFAILFTHWYWVA